MNKCLLIVLILIFLPVVNATSFTYTTPADFTSLDDYCSDNIADMVKIENGTFDRITIKQYDLNDEEIQEDLQTLKKSGTNHFVALYKGKIYSHNGTYIMGTMIDGDKFYEVYRYHTKDNGENIMDENQFYREFPLVEDLMDTIKS